MNLVDYIRNYLGDLVYNMDIDDTVPIDTIDIPITDEIKYMRNFLGDL